VFHFELVNLLTNHIGHYLNECGFQYVPVRDIVKDHILRREFFTLPSGIRVSIQHPFMSRAKTTSLRPQEMLDYAKRHGCQVAIGGNFHVSENVEEWDMDLGQCVCTQIGTMKHGSNFERRKMKIVDQGIAYTRIVSRKSKIVTESGENVMPRIMMTESAFYGALRPRPPVSNLKILNTFVKDLGIPEIEQIPFRE